MKKNLMQLQTSVNEEVKNEESEEIGIFESIEETPFTGVKGNKGWIIVMGNQMASGKTFDNLNDMKAYIDEKPWELIVNACAIFNEILNTNKKDEK